MLKQEKTKEQDFAKLVSMQRDMEKKLTVQERFIKEFQLLAQNEEEPSSMLELFSCPAAIFKRGGVLYRANRTLIENTDLPESEVLRGSFNFLGRITDENFAMLEAAEGVFYGKRALLSKLSCPLELFCKSWCFSVHDNYQSALFFPLPDREGNISFGVVMLMK